MLRMFDMEQFGGPGHKKKSCSRQKCTVQSISQPNLDGTISKLRSLVNGKSIIYIIKKLL